MSSWKDWQSVLELHWAVCSSVTGICKVNAQLSKCRQSIDESNDISEETGGQGASKGWVETLVSKKLETTRALDVLITSVPRLIEAGFKAIAASCDQRPIHGHVLEHGIHTAAR